MIGKVLCDFWCKGLAWRGQCPNDQSPRELTFLDGHLLAHYWVGKISDPLQIFNFIRVLDGIGNMVKLSQGRARNLNLTGLAALDLRTRKPSGEPRGFT